jgi:hypothetical protein
VSSLQWTLLAVGLPCVVLGASSMHWPTLSSGTSSEEHVFVDPVADLCGCF